MVGRKSHEGRPLGASSILPSGLHLPCQPWLRGSHGQDRREGRGPYRSNSGHEEPPAKEPVGSPTLPAQLPTGSLGIRASFRLGSGRGPRPPREQYACFIARHSRGLRPFRVALLILDSRLAPTTSTVRGGPGQHMEKRINPSTSGRV